MDLNSIFSKISKQIASVLMLSIMLCAIVPVTTYAADDKYSYKQMEKELKDIAESEKSLAALSSLGTTVDGRELYCLRVGKDNAKKKVLITGAIHAREYLTTELVMAQLKDFIEHVKKGDSYKDVSYKDMLKDTAVYFIPMVNPDGVTISQYGIDALNKDSTKELVKSITELDKPSDKAAYYRKWKSNAEGIDINRQFDAMWEKYNDHVGHPSSDHYKGTATGSAVEAKALIDLTDKEMFDRTVSYHTQGGVIYWFFGQTGELLDKTQNFAEALSKATGYKLDANYQNLDPAGYKDWAIIKKSIPSVTIEVGSGSNPLPHSQFDEIYKRNKNVVEETILNIK